MLHGCGVNKMLDTPKNIDFKIPVESDDDFYNASFKNWVEDKDLLNTGEWDNQETKGDDLDSLKALAEKYGK